MPITDLATNVILDNVGKVYFLKSGVYRDPVGLDNNHPLSSVSAMLIHIEDGVPQNVMVANYAPSKMASWASHDFPLWYRGQVEYTIAGESAPRTFAQYFTYVPSILVAMNKNGASIMDVNVTITQNTGANLLGGFADLTALNAEFPPTEELSDDVATAYVYDSGTKGFYRVVWNTGTSAWEWTLITQALVNYGVQTKQYNVLPIKVQRGYAPNQTPLTVSDEVIRLIYQEIAYINAVIANHTELIDDLNTDIVNHLADFDNPHQVTALQTAYSNLVSLLSATTVQGAIDEIVANKVEAFQVTPDDTHYPSEKLVKDQLDLKEDKSNKATAWGTPNDTEYPTTKLVDDRLDPIETFKDTTVPATYETIVNADTHRGRTTALENANMVKSIVRTGTNLFTITFYDGTTSNILTLAELKAFIGEATQSLSGLMSATDKTELDTLVALFDSDADDVVNTIAEILAIFEDYPEGVDLVTALAGKVDKTTTIAGVDLQNNITKEELQVALDVDDKVDKSQIVNDLTTGGATDVLSAEQGKTLQTTTEKVANKATDFSTVNDTKYPSVQAVRNYVRDIGLDTPIAELNNYSLREVFEIPINTNSDFNGITGYSSNNSSISESSGVITNTGDGTSNLPRFNQSTNNAYSNGKKYYTIIRARVTNINATSLFVRFGVTGMTAVQSSIVTNPIINTWYEQGVISTMTSGGSGNVQVFYGHGYVLAGTANGAVAEFDFAKTYDLTSLGIDTLTVEQMDYWYGVYEAIKNGSTTYGFLNTLYDLFTSKANATLEAWITPTLTTATTTYLKYRKDTLGTVIIEGNLTVKTAGTNFTLPTGYRPLFAYVQGDLTFNTNGTVVSASTGLKYINVRFTGGA